MCGKLAEQNVVEQLLDNRSVEDIKDFGLRQDDSQFVESKCYNF